MKTQKPLVKSFFDEATNTFTYVVTDADTKQSAIIDSVLDYDAASATTSTIQADKVIHYVHENSLSIEWILETHVHADHLTASQYLKKHLSGKIAMSGKISIVQKAFSQIYNLDPQHFTQYPAFDYLFDDDEHFKIGNLDAYNIPTPGHTPACLSYVIGDAVFVGDTLFMPDYGTARCDFPNGSAAQLYDSIQRLYVLPEHMRMFLCHDYLPKTRDYFVGETDVKTQKQSNIHIHSGTTKPNFIKMREARDVTLTMPKLILPAIQINMDAGNFPMPESNGQSYLKLPLNYFKV
ncbi:MBL fold metallo-hydrolase [Acinetobacter sp. S40]|uniref:MBL fold metallo-hydrolase n=1 Tax=unclassified Acinetobacter TaxID=196816 RepID=UPI00190E1E94|nr:MULTISPECIES: MBL fold metallo-hydrolase [unclassified Acinetobacter]MBJ9986663.1 MBL fold metallo-hydrolase [Acinetobacter sp. S40]MBK0063219.1 MBL fold metallo-hydrolase [Acinetobacter sp. S55]MBK0066869.1 MBL fold metallo-hydrolase [Acinetobacter sp. S54]